MNKRVKKKKDKATKELVVAVLCGQYYEPLHGHNKLREIFSTRTPKKRKDFDKWCKDITYEELAQKVSFGQKA